MIYYLIRYGDKICTPGRRFDLSVMEGSRENFERLMSGEYFPSWRELDQVEKLTLEREPEAAPVEHFWVATFRENIAVLDTGQHVEEQPTLVFPDPLTGADLELIKTIMMRNPKELSLERHHVTQWKKMPF
tara:strand:+ start:3966 stop:4358 length:393 start_codon:yes stop_codon:yes gene_type:complete